jgi:MFS family permease
MGMSISPTIGGIMYAHIGYASLFGVMFVLIGVDILLRLVIVEKKVAARILKGKGVLATRAYDTFQESIDGYNSQLQQSSESSNSSSATNPLMQGSKNPSLPQVNADHPLPLITLLKSPRTWTDLYGV